MKHRGPQCHQDEGRVVEEVEKISREANFCFVLVFVHLFSWLVLLSLNFSLRRTAGVRGGYGGTER